MSALCSSSQYLIVFPLFLCTFFLEKMPFVMHTVNGEKKVQTDCRNVRVILTINMIKIKEKKMIKYF